MTAALATGRVGLRDAENLSTDLPRKMQRRLGLTQGTVADTTIYELLPKVEEEELRPVLWEQLRRDLDSKAIRHDLFAGGVATFDGKGAGSGLGKAPNAKCRESVCDQEGTKCWDAFALRACLTSSLARPVLDQEYILRKTNEISTFPTLFGRLLQQFPKLFRYVTCGAAWGGEGRCVQP